jgi:hypothetical protein
MKEELVYNWGFAIGTSLLIEHPALWVKKTDLLNTAAHRVVMGDSDVSFPKCQRKLWANISSSERHNSARNIERR